MKEDHDRQRYKDPGGMQNPGIQIIFDQLCRDPRAKDAEGIQDPHCAVLLIPGLNVGYFLRLRRLFPAVKPNRRFAPQLADADSQQNQRDQTAAPGSS